MKKLRLRDEAPGYDSQIQSVICKVILQSECTKAVNVITHMLMSCIYPLTKSNSFLNYIMGELALYNCHVSSSLS